MKPTYKKSWAGENELASCGNNLVSGGNKLLSGEQFSK